jgi:hypothetical protein
MTTAQVETPVAATPNTTTPTPPEAAQNGRDAQGRFTVGNPGGPGNPFARRTAAMRKAIQEAATFDDLQEITRTMIALAKQGDTVAAKLVFQYVAGKPTDPPNPDRLDADEWQIYKDTAGMMKEAPGLVDKPDPVLPLTVVRKHRPHVTREICGRLGVVLANPETLYAAEDAAREAHFRQLERDSLRAAAKYEGFVPDETGLPPEVKPIQPKRNGKNGRRGRPDGRALAPRVPVHSRSECTTPPVSNGQIGDPPRVCQHPPMANGKNGPLGS